MEKITFTEKEYELLIDLNRKLQPDIIGISLRSSFFRVATAITKRIKRQLGIPVIGGGTHANVSPDECIQVSDMICIGEGEYPMLELAQRISEGNRIDDIQNLWIKTGNGPIRNPVRMLVRELDSLPFPDYGVQGKYLVEQNKIFLSDPALDTFNLDILA